MFISRTSCASKESKDKRPNVLFHMTKGEMILFKQESKDKRPNVLFYMTNW